MIYVPPPVFLFFFANSPASTATGRPYIGNGMYIQSRSSKLILEVPDFYTVMATKSNRIPLIPQNSRKSSASTVQSVW